MTDAHALLTPEELAYARADAPRERTFHNDRWLATITALNEQVATLMGMIERQAETIGKLQARADKAESALATVMAEREGEGSHDFVVARYFWTERRQSSRRDLVSDGGRKSMSTPGGFIDYPFKFTARRRGLKWAVIAIDKF